jgi:hypothetical protein
VQTDAKFSIYSRANFHSFLTFFKHKLIVTSTENLLVLFLKENYLFFIEAVKSEKGHCFEYEILELYVSLNIPVERIFSDLTLRA